MSISPESNETIKTRSGLEIHESTLADDDKRRAEFAIRVVELADEFDLIDHEYGPMGGTELQDDCQNVREFVRTMKSSSS